VNPGKQLPPPSGTNDLTALLRSRHVTADAAPARPAPPAPGEPVTAPAEPAQRPARAKGPAMDRRSWYMPKASADALAAAVEELHYRTRRPKHAVMAALVAVALEHLDEVQQRAAEQ